MDLNLKDKKAFVAGSSKGLGFATAKQLLKEGAKVVLNGRSEETLLIAKDKLKTVNSENVYSFQGDVTSDRFPEELSDYLIKDLQGLDILITNSAGPPAGGFDDLSLEDWERAIDLSFMSHLRLIRILLPILRKSSSASILTITSAAVKEPMPNLILSNSVRASTIGLTKSLANELGPEGIRVNSILPGWTKTERVDILMRARAEFNNSSTVEENNKITSSIPLKRMGDPAEFARAAAFLVSPAASYITGVMLEVDGGLNKGLV